MTNELTLNLTITGQQGAPRVPITVPTDITPSALRTKISETTNIPKASLRLIFRGRMIADDASKSAVAEYKLEEGSVIHCMGKPASAAAAVPAAASAAAAPPAVAAPPAGSTVTIAPPVAAPAATSPPADPLRAALQTLRASHSPADYQTAVQTLDTMLAKIIQHPLEPKYRQVKRQNAAFQRRLGGRTGGDAAMQAAGFVLAVQDREEVYQIEASAEAWPRLLATRAAVEAAVREAETLARPPVVPPPAMGMPGMPPGGLANNPMLANILSDPNALQAMMQNPMVQNMMRNDPRLAGNPMMQQAMEEIANNPAMAAQMSQLMRDPAMMQRMQAMMEQQGGLGGGRGGLAGMGAPVPRANGQQGGSGGGGGGNSGRSDEDMTEEEMIAEAIRRSLQDGQN